MTWFLQKITRNDWILFSPLVWFLFIVSKTTWEFFFNLASDSFPAPLVNLASAILISSLTLCLPPILTLLQSGSLQPTSWPTGFYLASTVIFFSNWIWMPLDEYTPHSPQSPHTWLPHALSSEGILARPPLVIFASTSIFYSACAAAKFWEVFFSVCVGCVSMGWWCVYIGRVCVWVE